MKNVNLSLKEKKYIRSPLQRWMGEGEERACFLDASNEYRKPNSLLRLKKINLKCTESLSEGLEEINNLTKARPLIEVESEELDYELSNLLMSEEHEFKIKYKHDLKL